MRLLLTLILTLPVLAFGQERTVGLLRHSPESFAGYTLISPQAYHDVVLIDNCGREVHRWLGEAPPMAVYLLPDGRLLRTTRISNPHFAHSSLGGRIELVSWLGEVLWRYDHSDGQVFHHHDVEYLPNGNILLLAWYKKTTAEAEAAGRDPQFGQHEVWPTQIVEIQPAGSLGGAIVWEWNLWDHLVQDLDPSKANYGIVSDEPGKLNINEGAVDNPDWIHANTIDYNAELDQILITARKVNEIWIIDHSTTTAEAASSSGGRYGRGGDFLYRWGNPEVYDLGDASDRQFFEQHDAQWIEQGLPGAGNVLVFDNGLGRPDGAYSRIMQIVLPGNPDGGYDRQGGQPFDPVQPEWIYVDPGSFYSSEISGVQRLANGNTLVCEGFSGRIFEVSSNGTIRWEYISPLSFNGPIAQGNPVNGNLLFRAPRYAPDYPAFQGRNLQPGLPLELDPMEEACETEPAEVLLPLLHLCPSGMGQEMVLCNPSGRQVSFEIFNLQGCFVRADRFESDRHPIDLRDMPGGVYYLRYRFVDLAAGGTLKYIKL